MLERIHYENREDWLNGRTKSIGASEAAAAVGLSPFTTRRELWEEKTGRRKHADLSENAAVQYGVRLEPAMREMYKAEHPDTDVEYYPYDVLYESTRPWMTCTLDGELTEPDGRKGVLEIKTAQLGKKVQWEKWQDAVPVQYFCQAIHQLLVTGWDFVVVYAKLVKLDGDSQIRSYRFEREKVQDDMDWLLQQETKFWNKFIVPDEEPPYELPKI